MSSWAFYRSDVYWLLPWLFTIIRICRRIRRCSSPTSAWSKHACRGTDWSKLWDRSFSPATSDWRRFSRGPQRWDPNGAELNAKVSNVHSISCAPLMACSFRDFNLHPWYWICACALTWFWLWKTRFNLQPAALNSITSYRLQCRSSSTRWLGHPTKQLVKVALIVWMLMYNKSSGSKHLSGLLSFHRLVTLCWHFRYHATCWSHFSVFSTHHVDWNDQVSATRFEKCSRKSTSPTWLSSSWFGRSN